MRLRDDHEDYYDRKLERDRECAFLAFQFCAALALPCLLLALAVYLLPGAEKIQPQTIGSEFFTKTAPGAIAKAEESP